MPITAPTRRPRADAQRNRAQLIAVAGQAFAEEGLDVALDTVAKRAGVGPGTLYRNFPNREELVSAVLEEHGPDLAGKAEAIAASGQSSDAALEEWLREVAQWMRAYEGLPEPLRAAFTHQTSLTKTCDRVIEITDRFLAAAQRDGHARAGIHGRDLYLGTLAIAWATSITPGNTAPDLEQELHAMLRHGWGSAR